MDGKRFLCFVVGFGKCYVKWLFLDLGGVVMEWGRDDGGNGNRLEEVLPFSTCCVFGSEFDIDYSYRGMVRGEGGMGSVFGT